MQWLLIIYTNANRIPTTRILLKFFELILKKKTRTAFTIKCDIVKILYQNSVIYLNIFKVYYWKTNLRTKTIILSQEQFQVRYVFFPKYNCFILLKSFIISSHMFVFIIPLFLAFPLSARYWNETSISNFESQKPCHFCFV